MGGDGSVSEAKRKIESCVGVSYKEKGELEVRGGRRLWCGCFFSFMEVYCLSFLFFIGLAEQRVLGP